jgi:pimeloyl-ACP methyl ester carboxylesterase
MKWFLCALPLLISLPGAAPGSKAVELEAAFRGPEPVEFVAAAIPGPEPVELVAAAIPGPEPVELVAADGQTIHGWYFAAGDHQDEHGEKTAGASKYAAVPAVVLLHMYRSDKSAWEPLMAHFRLAGVATLAIDMRGHGASKLAPNGSDLSVNSSNRDPKLFGAMWQDAQAAVDWLKKRGHKGERIGLMGASVGCSVAIDCARRNPELQCVAVLTPGKNYLGLDSMQHLKKWGTRELLLVSSLEEFDGGVAPMMEQMKGVKNARVETWILPDSRIHGTRMLNQVPNIEARLAMWFLGRLAPATDHATYFVPLED